MLCESEYDEASTIQRVRMDGVQELERALSLAQGDIKRCTEEAAALRSGVGGFTGDRA